MVRTTDIKAIQARGAADGRGDQHCGGVKAAADTNFGLLVTHHGGWLWETDQHLWHSGKFYAGSAGGHRCSFRYSHRWTAISPPAPSAGAAHLHHGTRTRFRDWRARHKRIYRNYTHCYTRIYGAATEFAKLWHDPRDFTAVARAPGFYWRNGGPLWLKLPLPEDILERMGETNFRGDVSFGKASTVYRTEKALRTPDFLGRHKPRANAPVLLLRSQTLCSAGSVRLQHRIVGRGLR